MMRWVKKMGRIWRPYLDVGREREGEVRDALPPPTPTPRRVSGWATEGRVASLLRYIRQGGNWFGTEDEFS